MKRRQFYFPELYYSDDGGVSDEEGSFSAWNREIWRAAAGDGEDDVIEPTKDRPPC